MSSTRTGSADRFAAKFTVLPAHDQRAAVITLNCKWSAGA